MSLMRLDDVILDELRRGPGTTGQIGDRISARVYAALERLRRAEKVTRSGPPGKGNEKIYALAPIKRRGPVAQNYTNGSSS
jgi:hypothetical protein